MSNSLRLYFKLLQSSISLPEFAYKLALILDRDPLFVPAYLEHIWAAEERHDRILRNQIIRHTKKVVGRLYIDSVLQKKISDTWTNIEMDALVELLDIQYENSSSLLERVLIKFQKACAPYWFDIKTRLVDVEREYVKLVKIVDYKKLQQEVRHIPPMWWNIETDRAMSIAHHQYTHTILLRNRVNFKEEYGPVDGVHESIRLSYADRFPYTYETVMELAKKLNIGLGRVVLVRLQPGEQAYRHYDSEIFLRGRKRFHLVVDAGPENILSAGHETSNVRPGEVWFFANKVMHRAHNKSKVPRVHVIFDGYPLEEVENLATSS